MTRTLDCTIERGVYIHFDCFIISYKYRHANTNEKKNVAQLYYEHLKPCLDTSYILILSKRWIGFQNNAF